MIHRRILITMLVLLLLQSACAGTLMFVRPVLADNQRQSSEDQLISMIEQGETNIQISYVPPVDGEGGEFDEFVEPEFSEEPDPSAPAQPTEPEEQITVTGYGVITIPSIDLKMPLVKGADNYSLRAAIGWYPESAEMGNAGNCVIFGHRMKGYGRHFNRLDELKAGDEVNLYHVDGSKYTYTVTDTTIIEPEELMTTLTEHNEGYTLTLVTCTPTGVGSHRLLVFGSLKTGEEN